MLLVALIAIDELIGPAFFRLGLARSGEIDATAPRPLLVVSNREPYVHSFDRQGGIGCSAATGGVAVALDALMRERGGTWIAHGAGTADRQTSDASERSRVPPGAPHISSAGCGSERRFRRLLRRIRERGFVAVMPPGGRAAEVPTGGWAAYKKVNSQFAAAIDAEMPSTDTPCSCRIIISARRAGLRKRRSAARTAMFWHIPWPYPDRLQICPWQRESLPDCLPTICWRSSANVIGAISLALAEKSSARISKLTAARPFQGPVQHVLGGTDRCRLRSNQAGRRSAPGRRAGAADWKFGLAWMPLSVLVSIGWITPREFPNGSRRSTAFFQRRPELRGKLTFVQIGVPSRSELESYGAIESEIDSASPP